MANRWQVGTNKKLVWLGVFLLLAGVASLIGYGSTHHLLCVERMDGGVNCSQQLRWMGLIPMGSEKTLHDVTRAEVEMHCSSYGRFSKYECNYNGVVIKGADEALHISHGFLNTLTAREMSVQINSYLAAPTAVQLEIRSMNWALLVLGNIFVTFSALCMGVILIWRQDLFHRHSFPS